MESAILVALGGSLGAALRYYLYRIPGFKEIPLGTLTVNTLGCFLLPFFIEGRNEVYFFFAVGFSGSLTTFSTLSYESFRLAERGNFKGFLLNITLNLFLGAIAFALGKKLSGGIL
jgi:CrcB protein